MRFDILDSFRGLCAIFVIMSHVEVYHSFYGDAFIYNSYLFVDFFFVLSGFVISHSLSDKNINLLNFKHFIKGRFFRVWPLHIFTLLCFLILLMIQLLLYKDYSIFSGRYSVESFIANVLLIQSLGLFDELTWNFPSWSISVEFYTYVLFYLALIFLYKIKPTHLKLILFKIFLIFSLYLMVFSFSNVYMKMMETLGIIRCLLGFTLGSLMYDLFIMKPLSRFKFNFSFFEVVLILSVAVFIGFVKEKSWLSALSPIIFSMVVILFSFEKGVVSQLLKNKFLLHLGKISYSLYLMHIVIFAYIFKVLSYISEKYDLDVFLNDNGRKIIDVGGVWNDFIVMFFLVLIYGVSTLTYKKIECAFTYKALFK